MGKEAAQKLAHHRRNHDDTRTNSVGLLLCRNSPPSGHNPPSREPCSWKFLCEAHKCCGALCAPRGAGPPERLNRTCGFWSCFGRRLCSSLGCMRARALDGCGAGAGRAAPPKRIPHSRTSVLAAARPPKTDRSHMQGRGLETGTGIRDAKSPGGSVHRQSVDTPSRRFFVPDSSPCFGTAAPRVGPVRFGRPRGCQDGGPQCVGRGAGPELKSTRAPSGLTEQPVGRAGLTGP